MLHMYTDLEKSILKNIHNVSQLILNEGLQYLFPRGVFQMSEEKCHTLHFMSLSTAPQLL